MQLKKKKVTKKEKKRKQNFVLKFWIMFNYYGYAAS